ncbi:MAG: FHA domain-containing protein [Nitrospirae bacterium]|nr:FHA domain-containing protein [Nitrospirota bacterium]
MYKLIEKKKGEKDKTFPLKGIVHEIGRASSCDISLSDNNKASRIHARLEKDSDGWWIVDLNSTNGTFVNKEKIKSRRLEIGDEISIGDSALIFLREDEKGSSIDDASTEFEQPRLNIKVLEEKEGKRRTVGLFVFISIFLMVSIAVWIFYSFYINTMNKIHRTAVVINNEMQKMELIYGDIETSKRAVFNLDLMKDNMPAIIDFLTKVQDNPRISDAIKKDAPDLTIASVKKGLDEIIELSEQINSYKKTLQQVTDATESFKRTQNRKAYSALIKEYNTAINEMDRFDDILVRFSNDIVRLNGLLVSLDKVSSKIVPSLSRNIAVILDASNKVNNDLSRLKNNMELERAYLLSVKG